jgi:hypothetical protein
MRRFFFQPSNLPAFQPSALLLAALLMASCKPAPKVPLAPPPASGPQVKATVVTITTVLQPGSRTLTHTVAIAGNRARSSDELDHWRLFDLAKGEVTFVDDLAKTYRRASLKTLIADRKAADGEPLPDAFPRAQFTVTSETRTLLGLEAKESVVRLGAYQRQLWIGTHPLIPQGLFAMMEASQPGTRSAAGVMREVDAALFDIKGFPLAEHAELPYDNTKMVLDRTVVKVEQPHVPQSLLNVGAGYRDVTKPASPSKPEPK